MGRNPAVGRQGPRHHAAVIPSEDTAKQLEVKQKDSLGGFTMLSGAIRKADGTRVLTVDFSVAWKTPAR